MNILVVDGDMSVNSLFCRSLERWGYSAKGVSSGEEALRRSERGAFDVVIINTVQKDMRAAELIPRIKGTSPDTKIVVMTQKNTARLERSIRKLGVVYYMTSLIPSRDLKSVLDHIA